MRPQLRETNQFFSEHMTPVAKFLFFFQIVSFLFVYFLFAISNFNAMIGEVVVRLVQFTPDQAIGQFNLWQFVTYITGMSASVMGIISFLFSLIMIYYFAPMAENLLGSKSFVRFLAVILLTAPVFHTVFFYAIGKPSVSLLGMSGILEAIFFLCVFAYPNNVICFFMIPAKLKHIGFVMGILLAIGLIAEIGQGFVGVSMVGHLAGVGAAYLMYRYPVILARLSAISLPGKKRRRRGKKGAQVISMGHPGRHSDPDDRYNDPHWFLDQ